MKYVLVLLALLFPALAHAQCANGILSNCPAAVSPQSTDLVYGWQPGQSPHSRSFTLQQLAAGGVLPTNNVWTGSNTFNGIFGGTGVATYLASPPAIGGTSAAAGSFTTLSASSTVTLGANTIALGASGTFYPGHGLIGIQTFCASGCTHTGGTYTPDAGTNQVIIEVQAPGGGGGGCGVTDASHNCVGGSGGGGAYTEGYYTSSFSGITMTVGSAGAGGTNVPGAGGTGGTTSAGSLISCPGGTGGPAGAQTTSGTYVGVVAGAAATSQCTNSGGFVLLNLAGQGTTGGYSSNITTGTQFPSQSGSSQLGRGVIGFSSSAATSAGITGVGYGCGALGAWSSASQAATAGASSCPGIIIVREFN